MTDGASIGQGVWLVAAPEETDLADLLIGPLRTAGYVQHQEGVPVGDSIVGAATDAVARGLPIILCATPLSVGSSWTYQIVNATRAGGRPRVFVVQMKGDTYVDHLSLQTRVARYDLEPARAVDDLLSSLRRHYPPAPPPARTASTASTARRHALDELAGLGADHVDLDAVQRFRERLRPERAAEYPAGLDPWQWLTAAQLWQDGSLTRAGALLFGRQPTAATMTGVVKCVRYFGDDRSARRELVTLTRGIPDQIRDARTFVQERVRRGEATAADQAEAAVQYEYPMAAVREIVANALVHRDHTDAGREVHVRLFTDRLEVSSPGGWPGRELQAGVTYLLDDLKGQSIKRNTWLAYVLSWASLFEGLGGGIPTAVHDCVNLGTRPPTVLLDDQGFVTVTLTKAEWSGPITSTAPGRNTAWPIVVGVLPPRSDNRLAREADRVLTEFASSDAGAAMVVVGTGGVGKTQVAAELARLVAGSGAADLTVWANASSRSNVLGAFAEAAAQVTGTIDADAERSADRFLGWLSSTGRRWLVVLDDVQDPADIRDLWPPERPAGRTLVTTRRRDAALIGSRRVLELGVLAPAESAEYLAARLGHDGRLLDEAAELADDLGHLPLALAQAAAYMLDRQLDCAGYRRRLAARAMAAVLPEVLPDDQSRPLSQTWTLSMELADTLAPRGLARPMFELVSVLDPNAVPIAALTAPAALAYLQDRRGDDPVGEDDARDSLHSLNRLSLLNLSMTSRTVTTHRLVQRACRETLSRPELDDAQTAAAAALLAVWPDVEVSGTPGQQLRANAAALLELGGSDPELSAYNLARRLGRSLGEAGQIEGAVATFDRLWGYATQRWGDDYPATLVARADRAAWQGRAGRPAEAARDYRGIVGDMRRVLGPDHLNTLTARRNLASWRSLAGDVDGARQDNVALIEDMIRLFGPDHPQTLTTRHNLAAAYAELGRHDTALEIADALIADEERVFGPDHPDVLRTRANRAGSLGKLGDPGAAVRAYEDVLARLTVVLGPDHPSTLATRAELALWRGRVGKVVAAVAEYTALLADLTRVLGSTHLDTRRVRARRDELARKAGIDSPSGATVSHGVVLGDLSVQNNTFG
ncbi:tetratricopeptide repeat protein [Actinoplanes sp. NPDC026619]|uniref:tetratricopeptide repeat protein n=1 Tax=Actinoplanes sp. NPDC026619 TaxID=3155798 RepID=UPI003403D0E8